MKMINGLDKPQKTKETHLATAEIQQRQPMQN
jgi:hypothetical protein